MIDRVRVDRANEFARAATGGQGAHRLLLRNRDSLRAGEEVQLQVLLEANRSPFVVHALRDALKEL